MRVYVSGVAFVFVCACVCVLTCVQLYILISPFTNVYKRVKLLWKLDTSCSSNTGHTTVTDDDEDDDDDDADECNCFTNNY